jgi:hypothetical protein
MYQRTYNASLIREHCIVLYTKRLYTCTHTHTARFIARDMSEECCVQNAMRIRVAFLLQSATTMRLSSTFWLVLLTLLVTAFGLQYALQSLLLVVVSTCICNNYNYNYNYDYHCVAVDRWVMSC